MFQLTIKAVFVVSLLTLAAPLSAADKSFGWADLPTSAYPGAFWWWMGSAVNQQELERNINELSEAGIRTLRLETLYKAELSALPNIRFLSDEWNQLAKAAIDIGKNRGVEIDLWGNGWPFGGPWIKPEHAARRLEWDNVEHNVTVSQEKVIVQDTGEPIIAVIAMPPGEEMTKGTVAVQSEEAGKPTWRIPPGTWDIYVFRNGFTELQVKRATVGGEGPMLDHFSTEALYDYLRPFENLMKTVGKGGFGRLHEDSYEVYQANWTEGVLDFFNSRRGYDLRGYLPALISESSSELARRVRHDYRWTIQEMLIEKHLLPFMKWVRDWGSKVSYQAQGCPGHLVDLYGLADQPDPEAFGREGMASDGLERRSGGFLCSKFASSSAHIHGRQFVSSETFTWLEDHFCSSLDRMRNDLDYYFLAGINHIYFHSTTYSPSDVPFPGWLYYASVHIDRCQPWWEHVPAFTDYIARCQTPLQDGRPGEDILLLYPIHDLWHDDRGATNLLQYCQVHNFWNWCGDIGKQSHDTAAHLWNQGWKFDWCSDNSLISKTSMEGDLIASGDGRYQALIIPECLWVQPRTTEAVRNLVRSGASVFIIGEPPQAVPSGDPQERPLALSSEERRAQFVPEENGKGKIRFLGSIAELDEALSSTGAVREPMADQGILSIRRVEGDGSIYFLKNVTNQTIDGWIPLGLGGTSAEVGDPVSGKSYAVEVREQGSLSEVRIRLMPTESRLVRVSNTASKSPIESPRPEGLRMELKGPWTLTWTPHDASAPKTLKLDRLADWREIEDLRYFSGKVVYQTEFTVADSDLASGCILELAGLHESASVQLNGKPMGAVWTSPYRIDLTPGIKPGINQLEIGVINLLANRIIQMEQKGPSLADRHYFVNYSYGKFDAARWEPLPSGLTGSVHLVGSANP